MTPTDLELKFSAGSIAMSGSASLGGIDLGVFSASLTVNFKLPGMVINNGVLTDLNLTTSGTVTDFFGVPYDLASVSLSDAASNNTYSCTVGIITIKIENGKLNLF